jgi:membrane protein implicated in regulation of membrane protease activity
MKWIVASLGALLVTGGAFIAIMIIPALILPVIYTSPMGLVAMYVVGFALAISAGVLSFRATLRQYEPRQPPSA